MLIKENLLDNIDIPKENIHPIHILDTVQSSARKYEEDINSFFKLKEGEIPQFELIMLGIGEDGHTASLFPGTKALCEKEHLVMPACSGGVKYERITMTLPLINNARNIIFLVTGRDKREIVKKVLENDKKLPASLIKPYNIGEVFYLLDKEAAREAIEQI